MRSFARVAASLLDRSTSTILLDVLMGSFGSGLATPRSLRGILVRLRAAKRASENLEVASLVPELVLPRNPAPRARTDRQPRPTLRLG